MKRKKLRKQKEETCENITSDFRRVELSLAADSKKEENAYMVELQKPRETHCIVWRAHG